ncbi:formamidopyrimidine-DNA glycosylase [Thermoplasmatales archaeon SM1-50]|nr:MAG: formamidopyrimidine-DNA glycosylase [Thermoplasmatales archaeon SM1-50]
MIELTEAITLSKQLNDTINGKIISKIIAAHTKQKLTWYYGNPQNYQRLLHKKKIDYTTSFGGFVEISAQTMKILFRDGVNLRFFENQSKIPEKHQLLLEFIDHSMLVASVQMYGGVGCFIRNELDNTYYTVAKEKPSPLSKEFDKEYFTRLIRGGHVQNLSIKAFLATEQRIPGLGNGVLQDILFNAKLHPKQKITHISEKQTQHLFESIKATLTEMVNKNGRDTERDLFGRPGEYRTKMCKNTVGKRCEICGSTIMKSNYMGGSIYFCPGCQTI